MLMSSDDNETSWLSKTIEQPFTHSLTSELAMDKTIVHCGNLLVSAMKTFAVRPEKRSNYEHYTFLTEHHPYQCLDALFAEAITSIWQDPCISTVLERSAGLPSMDIVPQ
jgi:guanine nucleotide-binding protein G(i) subunit alpha